MKENKEALKNLILPLITVACILLLWTIASISVGSKYILPSIAETFRALIKLLGELSFYLAFIFTLIRSLIAFAISFLLALTLALLSQKSQTAKRLISPVIGIMRALPTVAVVLLLLFWTNSQIAPVIVTMLVVLPTVYNGCITSIESLDKEVLEMCALFNVDNKKTFFKVVLPGIAPSLLINVGSGISLNLKLMVAAEVLASTVKSIGGLLNYSNYNLQTAMMIALVVVTVCVGLLIEKIFSLISRKVGKWQ